MEITQLKYFKAAAELEHMTNAAKQLHIAQPALTQSIHKLEDELGLPLFKKSGRNIALTAEGRHLYEMSAPLLSEFDGLKKKMADFAHEREGSIKVCIKSASVLLVNAMASFAHKNPDVSFQITQDLGDSENDIVIRSFPKATRERDGIFYTERIGVAVPLGFSDAKNLSIRDLEGAQLICLSGSVAFREICDALCLKHGVKCNVSFESDNPSVVRKMIGMGLGVGFWPEFSWGEPDAQDVELKFFREKDFTRDVGIMLSDKIHTRKSVQKFYKHLIDHFDEVWKKKRS